MVEIGVGMMKRGKNIMNNVDLEDLKQMRKNIHDFMF